MDELGEDTGTDGVRTEWDAWRLQLPRRVQDQLDYLLRRALRRRLALLGGSSDGSVPDAVRGQAVAQWRKRYMAGRSKSAKKRMNYARLKSDPTYQEIEWELLGAYKEREGLGDLPDPSSVKVLTFAEVCEAYRRVRSSRDVTLLDDVARGVVSDVCGRVGATAKTCDEMAEAVCRVARTERVPHVRRDRQDGHPLGRSGRHAPHVRRSHRGDFDLIDVASEQGVVDRVLETHLAERIVQTRYGSGSVNEAARSLIIDRVDRHPHVVALRRLARALLGSDALGPVLGRQTKSCAREVETYLTGEGFAREVAGALLDNPLYAVQYQRSVELLMRVRDHVPETPMEAYPLARTMRRHFTLHVGPTNSGKTHDALRVLAAAESGAYLGPLRLLAYEQYGELNRMGTPCSLLTGEEAVEVAGARHVSSTVEMADFRHPVEVVVIDEAQMVADRDRGHHWTEALLGIPAWEVQVCCAPHAEQVIRGLVALCGDELTVVRHERLVPLEADRGGYDMPGDVEPGDALVVFSRRSVHAVAAQVAAAGLRPSLVYGALPHDVRHEEARRFDAGETDVVVATDAIGMGMNLPIRRVVFVEQEKYDGHVTRPLLPEEVQQIAGRAGRFGRYGVGLYQSTRLREDMVRRYQQPVAPIEWIPVGIPADIALVRDATLTECIRQWMALEQPEPFRRISVARDLMLISEVEGCVAEDRRTDINTKRLILSLATMPFDEGDRELRDIWRRMVEAELVGGEATLEIPCQPVPGDDLSDLERRHRHCDLLYTYARMFGHSTHLEALNHRRYEISHAIMEMLART